MLVGVRAEGIVQQQAEQDQHWADVSEQLARQHPAAVAPRTLARALS